jgi:hypothetical protein
LFDKGPVVPFPQLLAAATGRTAAARRAAEAANVAIFFIFIFSPPFLIMMFQDSCPA